MARAARASRAAALSSQRHLLVLLLCAGVGCAAVKTNGSPDAGESTGQPSGTGGGAETGSQGTGGTTGSLGSVTIPDGGGTLTADVPPNTCTHLNIGILGNPGANGSSNFQSWLEARGTTVQRIQTTADVPLTADTLSMFDVVILDWLTRDYTADEAAIFGAWVTAGGGVAAMSGYADDTTKDWHANSLLSQIGIAFGGDRIWGPVMQFADNPITAGLTSVTFTGGYPVVDLGGAGTRTPIAFITSNSNQVAVSYTVEIGTGKAFVWGDEWIQFDSEWSSMPQIPMLWLQVFSWLAPANRCTLIGIG